MKASLPNQRWLGRATRTVLVTLMVSIAAGQPADDAGAVDDLRAGALQPDVYIKDSFEAQDLLAKAQRAVERENYAVAAALLDQVLRDHADKLTATEGGLYESMPVRVHRLIAGLPAPGVAAYRALTEGDAAAGPSSALDEPRIEELLALTERYFCTASGARMSLRAAELAIEAGDFALAVRLYRTLRTLHPDRAAMLADVTARLALVYALWGRSSEAEAALAEGGPDASATLVRWKGELQPIGSLIATVQPVRPLNPAAEASPDWPLFGGHPSRNAPAIEVVDQATLLWEFVGFGDDSPSGMAERIEQRAVDQGRWLGMMPVTAGGLVFVQDGMSIWAVHAQSGKLAWTKTVRAPDEPRQRSTDLAVAPWHSPAVANGRLYACMGGDESSFFGVGVATDVAILLCLDAASGAEIWRMPREQLGLDSAELYFDPSPLAVDERVFAIVRRRRSFGFEDAYLFCFDATSGQVRWHTHIGSASAGGFGYRRATLSIPAMQDDTVYVNSNLGGIAAVWAANGRVRWLRLYPRQSDAVWKVSGRGASREVAPWDYNPAICAGPHLVVAPMDAAAVFVLDRETGSVRSEIPLESIANAQAIVGVDGERMYGYGDSAFCWDLAEGRQVWLRPLPAGPPLGRGLLTEAAVLVPSRSSLMSFARADGLPSVHSWSSVATPGGAGNESGGNLLTVPGQLLVAGFDVLSAYARKEDVWSRLRERMAQFPRDPSPALDLAEIAIRSGDPGDAILALGDAIERVGGFADPIEADIKKRIFDDCLAFAESLFATRRAAPPDEPAADQALVTIDKLFEFASQCPPNSVGHVRYRLLFADFYATSGRADTAVRLYQQILMDASLRDLPVVDHQPPAGHGGGSDGDRATRELAAGELAARRIGELIDRFGREVYASFDAEAAARLERLRAARDTAGLDQLASTFPRAMAAPLALLARAQVLQEDGKPIEAVRVLISVLTRYRTQVDVPEVLRDIAEACLASGRIEDAWAWLSKAAREYPTARVAVRSDLIQAGSAVTFAEYRDALGDVRRRVERSLPALTLPLDRTYEREFDEGAALLDPLFSAAPETTWRDYYVFSGGAIHSFAPRLDRPVWDAPAECSVQPALLVSVGPASESAGEGLAVFATAGHAFALDRESGRTRWSIGAPADDAHEDGDEPAGFRAFGYAHGRLAAAREDGTMLCVDVYTGRELWRQPLAGAAVMPVAIDRTYVAFPAGAGGNSARNLTVLDAQTGQAIRAIELDDGRNVERVFLTLAEYVVTVTAQTVAAYDPPSGQMLWNFELPDRELVPASAELDLDGLYVCESTAHRREHAGRLHKISLDDGRLLWSSEPLSRRPDDGLMVRLAQSQLLVTGERFVVGVDSVDGRIVWEGTVDRDVSFARRFVTDRYVVAIDQPPMRIGGPVTVYFYETANRSGLIPAKHGWLELGKLDDVRAVTVRDNALLVQTGRTLHAWTHAE